MNVSPALPLASPRTPTTDVKRAAQQFEAVFLRQMIGAMRKGKLSDEMFSSSATENFREMADAHMADAIARRGVFGIARLLEQELGPTT